MHDQISAPQARRGVKALRVALALGVAIAIPVTFGPSPTNVSAACTYTAVSAGNNTCVDTQSVTATVSAGSLSVVVPGTLALGSITPGSNIAATNLGLLNFTNTLNNGANWSVTMAATDLYCSTCSAGHQVAVPFTAMTVTAGNQFQAKTGAVGTPANGAGGALTGSDTTPGTTFSSGVTLVGSTAGSAEGSWDEAPVADACAFGSATAGCNQIAMVVNGSAGAGSAAATIQYTITG